MEPSQVAKVELGALAAKDMDFPSSSLVMEEDKVDVSDDKGQVMEEDKVDVSHDKGQVMEEDKVDVSHDKGHVCDPPPPGELEDSMIEEGCVRDATEVCHSCTHDHNCHCLYPLNLLLDFISAGSHNEFITA